MGMLRLMGLFAVIPTTILLTVSFFVLVVIRKIENQGLKAFGYVVAALLWIGALLFFSAGVYTVSTGRHPMMGAIQCMMKCPMYQAGMGGRMSDMPGSKHMMMKDKMPPMIQQETEK